MEQLELVGFVVEQHPQVLEHVQRQLLALIDQQHGRLVLRDAALEEVMLDRLAAVERALAVRHPEQAREVQEELVLGFERGIQDDVEVEAVLAREVRQERARQRGLARSDIAQDQRQSAPQPNGDFHAVERLQVGIGAKEKRRVRAGGKWLARQPQLGVVAHPPTCRGFAAANPSSARGRSTTFQWGWSARTTVELADHFTKRLWAAGGGIIPSPVAHDGSQSG